MVKSYIPYTMIIRFNELLDYDQFPSSGKHIYFSSKVVELEFIKDEVSYFIKCHIDFKYQRWHYPETHWGPKEDECEIVQFDVETIKGYKVHNEQETILSEKDLRKLHEHIKSEITFE